MTINVPVGFGLCSIVWQCNGSPRESVTTFGYDPGALDPQSHADTIYDLFNNAGAPGVATIISDNWTLLGIRCSEQDDPGPLFGEHIEPVAGLLTGGAVPPNSAVLLQKNTGVGGRRNKGRMYVPPVWPNETAISGRGLLLPADQATLATRWNQFRTAMTTAGLPWVLFHSEVPFTPTPITSLSVGLQLATQRRRMRR